MKRPIMGALPAFILFAVFCGLIVVFGNSIVDIGTVVAAEPEDSWVVHVSLVEGPLTWDYTVTDKWVAEAYVSKVKEDERYGGHWTIYFNEVVVIGLFTQTGWNIRKGGGTNMEDRLVLDVGKALDEKRQMAKIFEREHGCRSGIFDILIEHFEGLQ